MSKSIYYEIDLDDLGLCQFEIVRREHNGWVEPDGFGLVLIDGRTPTEEEKRVAEDRFEARLPRLMDDIIWKMRDEENYSWNSAPWM